MSHTVRQRRLVSGRVVVPGDLVGEARSVLSTWNGGIDRENVQQSAVTLAKMKTGAFSELLAYDEVTSNDYSSGEAHAIQGTGTDPWVVTFDSLDEVVEVEAVVCCASYWMHLFLDGVAVASLRNHQRGVRPRRLSAIVPLGAGSHSLSIVGHAEDIRDRAVWVMGARR